MTGTFGSSPRPTCMQWALVVWKLLRLRTRWYLGMILNLAGIPGLVRDCDYTASITDARVKVRASGMFTIITVNGLDIYFHRLTGKIDGVGFATHCTRDEVPR